MAEHIRYAFRSSINTKQNLLFKRKFSLVEWISSSHVHLSKGEEEVEEVYEELEEVLSSVKGKEKLIIRGDWKARVGVEKEEGICGEYGL